MKSQITLSRLKCSLCDEMKPIEQFWRHNGKAGRRRDGRNTQCLDCARSSRTRYEMLPDSDERISSGVRKCNLCHEERPLAAFGRTQFSPMGRQYRCYECIKESKRTGPRAPGLLARDYQRLYYRGVTPDQFRALFDAQQGRCGICAAELDFLGKDTCLDHDHDTDVVRGILCGRCNRGIGHMRDSIALLEAAIAYLQRHAPQEEKRIA